MIATNFEGDPSMGREDGNKAIVGRWFTEFWG
jgi:hypothetical protein